ncbi:MAG: hypothetical protein H0V45_01265 [Actinobacteria bacterium]|nr:hypothetical protein [Actinomycetota bacterium]
MTDGLLVRVAEAVLHEALRAYIADGMYPEYVRNLSAVKKAIVLCACGQPDAEVIALGYRTQAGIIVVALNLECFIEARVNARVN